MERVPSGPIVKLARPQVVKAGAMIADKYRIEKELGRGGFGVVVRARHLAIDQVVAIKILTGAEGGQPERREDAARFTREAQATAALRSEHVVRILDVDFLEDGNPYMVMEYLEGETLHQLLHSRPPLSVGEAVDHVVQVLAALGEAHAAGIVHRDLKPANVLVTSGAGGTAVVKVLDFGVSKIAADSGIGNTPVSQAITKTGAVIGTVAYMAPEQMLDAKRVDGRADLWSIGIMLYELLTRQTPFGPTSSPTIVTTMLTKPPASLLAVRPDVPPKLERIVMRCLEKSADDRYATAAEVGAALASLTTPRARGALDALRRAAPPMGAAAPIEQDDLHARLPAGAPRPATRMRRITLVVVAAAVGAALAILGLALGVLLATPKGARPRIQAADARAPAPAATGTVAP
jgi:serine/threonine-protein kinase